MAREPWYVCVRQLVEQRRLAICQVPSAKCQVETAVAQTALHIHGANKGDGQIYSIRETARLLPFAGNCSTPNCCIYLFCELTPSTQSRQCSSASLLKMLLIKQFTQTDGESGWCQSLCRYRLQIFHLSTSQRVLCTEAEAPTGRNWVSNFV